MRQGLLEKSLWGSVTFNLMRLDSILDSNKNLGGPAPLVYDFFGFSSRIR